MSGFCNCKSYSHFFCKNISVYAIFKDQSFNDTLTNNIVSFEQLGSGKFSKELMLCMMVKILSKDSFKYFLLKIGFDISCKLSPVETICMKYQSPFLGKLGKK